MVPNTAATAASSPWQAGFAQARGICSIADPPATSKAPSTVQRPSAAPAPQAAVAGPGQQCAAHACAAQGAFALEQGRLLVAQPALRSRRGGDALSDMQAQLP